jgi:hypothetical protein
MTRLKKAAAVPGVPGVPGPEEGHVRARDQAGARAIAGVHEGVDLTGDTGDTGDTYLDLESFPAVDPSPVLSPVAVHTGDTSIAEVRALEVRFLGDLPVPFTLSIRDHELGHPLLFSTSRGRVEAARAARELVWAPLGFEVAAYAVQEGLADAQQWRWWCQELRDPSWRLASVGRGEERRAAMVRLTSARRARPITEPTITLGALLDAVGAELVHVQIEAS